MSDLQGTGTDTTAAGEPQETTLTTGTALDTTATETTSGAKPAASVEEVTYDFKAPEGIELNPEDLGEFTKIAKDLKLPADKAQGLVDLVAKREQARAEAFTKTVNDWAEQVKADKELGTPESLASAAKVIDTFGTPELKAVLNSTGLGNHPEVVRLAVKIGKAISEDKIVGAAGSGNAPRNTADILYGTPTN